MIKTMNMMLAVVFLLGTFLIQPISTQAVESDACIIYKKAMENDEEAYQTHVAGLENMKNIQANSSNPSRYDSYIVSKEAIIVTADEKRKASAERYQSNCGVVVEDVEESNSCQIYRKAMEHDEESYQVNVDGLATLKEVQANSSEPDKYDALIQDKLELIAIYDERRKNSTERYETFCTSVESEISTTE